MRNLASILFLFIYLASFSQENNHIKGSILKDRQFLIDQKEISAIDENENFVSIRPHRINGTLRNYYVEYYNELNFDSRIEIETQNQTEILDVFILKNKAYVFIKEIHKDDASLRFDIIDLNNKSISKKNLLNVNKKKQANLFKSLKHNTNIYIAFSNTTVLSIPFTEDNKLVIQVYSYNQNLNRQFEKTIQPNEDIKPRNISFLNVFQNQGLSYLLFNYKDVDNKKFYQIIEFNNSNSRELTIPINHDYFEIVNSNITNNTFTICGLTSEKRKGGYKGFSNYKVNLIDFTLETQKYSPFKSKEISKYFKGLFKNNRDVDIRDIFIDDQRNTYLIGQFYKTVKQAVPIGPYAFFAAGAFAVYITYNPIHTKEKMYDDILIAKIDSNGNLIWDKLLELRETKKITSISYHRDSSYFTFFNNNQVNILMNGFINMEKEKLIVKQDKRKKKTNFYNITISPEGKIKPLILLSNADSGIIFKAKNTIISGNNIYNLGQGNMRKQLIKISQ